MIHKSICKRLGTKNSKQVGDGQYTVEPSDPNIIGGWVQNSICLWKKAETNTKFVR